MEKEPETMPWCNTIEDLEVRWQKIIGANLLSHDENIDLNA